MNNKTAKALLLADSLNRLEPADFDGSVEAELRRLHARSEEQERLLRDALEALGEGSGWMTRVRLITAIRKHLGDKT